MSFLNLEQRLHALRLVVADRTEQLELPGCKVGPADLDDGPPSGRHVHLKVEGVDGDRVWQVARVGDFGSVGVAFLEGGGRWGLMLRRL
jgi:hypothetical protein